jgi:predicted ATPase/DNA-binding SARP family transcriptional activator
MVRFGILGPVEVFVGERRVAVGGPRQVALLAFLLVHANRAVSVDRLIDALWGDQDPAGAVKRVQVAIARLRKALGPDDADGQSPLRSTAGGYLLAVGPGDMDAEAFSARIEEGREVLVSGDAARAAELLRNALSLWRGPPLAEVAYESFAQGEIRRLDELRLIALEARVEADLQIGQHARVIGELQALLAAHPTRERLAELLMLGLYRCDRQADALEVFQHARTRLAEELGLQPGPSLIALQQQILTQDPELLQSRWMPELERSIRHQDETLEPASDPAAPPPTSLPVPVTPFLGRACELADVTSALRREETRMLTLTGAGGSGKTRLALRAAEVSRSDYPDGVWFVAFADIADPELIAPTICQALQLGEQIELTPARRLQGWLAHRRLLLVLDNLEQLAEGACVLGELLAVSAGLTLLVTSREPLHLAAERQYDVPVLARGDAIELFTTRAQAVKPSIEIDPEVAAGICERLDCLALAIELAAARTKALAPGDMLTRLDTRLPLLTGGPRDAPPRQQTLKATIDWSYELLHEEQRRLFARLSVFAGGCTLAAAEGVCGAELDTLQGLVDRSLVRHDGERYWMLPTLREYALERLEQTGEAKELRRLHARWFVELVHSEGQDARAPAMPSLHNRVRDELENFRGALEWSAKSGDSEAVARLACPLTFHWWLDQGQLQEAQRWVEVALEPRATYPPWLRARVLNTATHLAWRQGDEEQALAFFEQAAAILPHVDDPNIVCEVMMSRGVLAYQRGDIECARAAIEDVTRFARERNLPELPYALVDLSDFAIEQGRLDEGRALCEEALACSEGPTSSPARVALINLSEIAALQGRYGDALSLGRTALAAALDHGDQTHAVYAAFEIAWPLAELGELERSGRLIGAATAFLQEAGFARTRSDLLCEKAVLDALHRRLPADAVHTLVQQGRDTPLERALSEAPQGARS